MTKGSAKTFANDEDDDPSRVGAAMDPLMDGMEQLDTVISFRDSGWYSSRTATYCIPSAT